MIWPLHLPLISCYFSSFTISLPGLLVSKSSTRSILLQGLCFAFVAYCSFFLECFSSVSSWYLPSLKDRFLLPLSLKPPCLFPYWTSYDLQLVCFFIYLFKYLSLLSEVSSMKARIMSDLFTDKSQYVLEIADVYIFLMNNWGSASVICFNKIGSDWGGRLWMEDGERNEGAYWGGS